MLDNKRFRYILSIRQSNNNIINLLVGSNDQDKCKNYIKKIMANYCKFKINNFNIFWINATRQFNKYSIPGYYDFVTFGNKISII